MSEKEKLLKTIIADIILSFGVMFAIAGMMYLIGNVIIGWFWMTFDICVSLSGGLMVLIGTIILIIFDWKEDDN